MKLNQIIIILLSALLLDSCYREEFYHNTNKPHFSVKISTSMFPIVTQITVKATFFEDEDYLTFDDMVLGLYISKTKDFELKEEHTESELLFGLGNEIYSQIDIRKLKPNTTYYVKGFIRDKFGSEFVGEPLLLKTPTGN